MAGIVAFARSRRGLTAACGILALTVLLSALDVGGIWGPMLRPFGPSAWWGLLTVAPGAMLVAMHGRRPLLALLLGAALFATDFAWFGTVGMIIVIHELIYGATVALTAAGRRWMLVALAVTTIGIATAVAALTLDLRATVLAAVLAFAFFGTPYSWATAVRQAGDAATLRVQRAEDAERAAIRQERTRMAGELHDAIAGQLAAVALRSEGALARSADEPRDRAALAAIREASVRGLDEMRSMIVLLRSGAEPETAADRLDRLPQIIEDAGIEVHLAADDLPPLPAAVDQAVTRIVRESLLNAAKHAAGGRVRLRIESADAVVRVHVHSSGGRSTGTAGAGHGLVSMRERAEALGGDFHAGPTPDGWSVVATVPWQAAS